MMLNFGFLLINQGLWNTGNLCFVLLCSLITGDVTGVHQELVKAMEILTENA